MEASYFCCPNFYYVVLFPCFKFLLLIQVWPEIKKKAAEAKARGDEAFKQKDYLMAVDAYTQVCYSSVLCHFDAIFLLILLQMEGSF